jgi:hypothetical protein
MLGDHKVLEAHRDKKVTKEILEYKDLKVIRVILVQ